MEHLDTPPAKSRMGVIVVILVVVGIVGVGAGGYLAWSRTQGGSDGPAVDSRELEQWCKLRQEWAKKVETLVGDILLKSVKPEDKGELDKLVVQRNTICQDYARQLRDMKVTDPTIQKVEIALVKEGKTRANVAIEISNLLAKLDAVDTSSLGKNKKRLETYIANRIERGRAEADKEVNEAMAPLGSSACSGIYRGPMTDEGTSDNPYTSWDELEIRRSAAVRRFEVKIKEMQPVEEFTNRVYHELVRLYRPILVGCFQKTRAKNPQISEQLGLRIRLKRSGEVATLAIEWMEQKDERFLDCLLEKAAKWRLPRPDPATSVVVVSLDFKRL
jgi:hypothetical protein